MDGGNDAVDTLGREAVVKEGRSVSASKLAPWI